MSQFYGRMNGGRQEVTRTGHKTEGLNISASSFTSKVSVRYFWDEEKKENHVIIEAEVPGENASAFLFHGSEAELAKKLKKIK